MPQKCYKCNSKSNTGHITEITATTTSSQEKVPEESVSHSEAKLVVDIKKEKPSDDTTITEPLPKPVLLLPELPENRPTPRPLVLVEPRGKVMKTSPVSAPACLASPTGDEETRRKRRALIMDR